MKENGEMDLVFGGKGHSMIVNSNGEAMAKDTIIKMQNEKFDAYKKAMDDKTKKEIEEAKKMEKRMESLEIMPINSYVLVKPYAKNPFDKIEVTDSGLIIPTYEGKFMNPDTGEEDQEQNLSVQAEVIEVSPSCKYIKEGDVVYYRRVSGVPIPFFRQGLEVVAEQQIQVIINEGLKERFKTIK